MQVNDPFCTSQKPCLCFAVPICAVSLSVISSLFLVSLVVIYLLSSFVTELRGDCKVIHSVKWLYCLNLLPIYLPSVTVTNVCTSCKMQRHHILYFPFVHGLATTLLVNGLDIEDQPNGLHDAPFSLHIIYNCEVDELEEQI